MTFWRGVPILFLLQFVLERLEPTGAET